MRKEVLRVSHLDKSYDSTMVLQDFSMNLYEGEALGILGLHDSGKTTLLNIIIGKESFSKGDLYFDEEKASRKFDVKNKVSIVQSRSALVGNLSVMDNIFVLRRHYNHKLFIRKKVMEHQIKECFKDLCLDISPYVKVEQLSDMESYIVEIVKAYILGAKIILIDNISLEHTMDEYLQLNSIIRLLKSKGISFVVTGYQIENLQLFTDRILFLSCGRAVKVIESSNNEQIQEERILIGQAFHKRVLTKGKEILRDVVFEIKDVCTEYLKHVDLQIYGGEIIAILDLAKKSNEELLWLIMHPETEYTGKICFAGEEFKSNKKAYKKNVVFANFQIQDRIVEHLKVRDNLCLSGYRKFSDFGFINWNRIKFIENDFDKWYGEGLIKRENCVGLSEKEKIAIYLYRIQLQKGKVLFISNLELVADYLTSRMIEEQIRQMADSGLSICIFSSNVERIYNLADRFAIMSEGELKVILTADEFAGYFLNRNSNMI